MIGQGEGISEVEQLRLRVTGLERENGWLRSVAPKAALRSIDGGQEKEAATATAREHEFCQDARMRLLADAVPAAIAYVDRDECYRFANQAYAARHGMGEKALLGKTVEEIHGRESYAAIEANVGIALSGRAVAFEVEKCDRDGKSKPASVRYLPDAGPDGRVLGFFAVVSNDLPDNRDTQEALRASEARLQAFMDNMPAEMGLKDRSGRYLHINRFAETLYGLTSGEICGLSPHEVFPQKLADELAAQDRHVLETGSAVTQEVEAGLGDGLQTYLATKFPILDEDGEVTGLGAIAIDISEQKRQHEALRKTEALYNESERLAGLGHWEWDEVEDRCSYCSEEFARLHDMSVDEFLRQAISTEDDGQVVHPQDRARWRQVIKKHKEQKCGYEIEYRLLRRDGEVLDVREVAKPVLDDQGRLVRSVGYVQDISAQKQAERALRESESLLNNAAHLTDLGHWVWDEVSDRMVVCSEGLARLDGMTVEEYLARFGTMEAVLNDVHPEDRPHYERVIAEARRTGQPYELEYRDRAPDGDYRYLRERGEPVFDEDGKLIRSVGIIQDITKYKKTEEALREKEALLQAFMDNMPGQMALKDRAGRYLHINRFAESLHDLTPEGIRGLLPHDIYPKKLADEIAAHDRHVLETGTAAAQVVEADLGDGMMTYLATKFPILDEEGEVTGLGAIAIDISEQKRQEEALRKTEALYKESERLAGLGHWEWDEVEDRCSYCSEELARLHGMSVDEYLRQAGSTEDDSQFVHPEDRDRWREVLKKYTEQKRGYVLEYRLLRCDGEILDVREVAKPVLDDRGRLVRSVGYVQDITAQKQAERALRESESLLNEAAHMADLGHWVWDEVDDSCVYCSEGLARLSGLTVEGYLTRYGTTQALLDDVHPDDRRRYASVVAEAKRRGQPYEIEFRDTTLGGDYQYLRERGEPVFDEDGKHIRTVGIVQDITKYKQIEAALAEAQRVAKIGHWEWSIDGDELISCSAEYARIHGVPQEAIAEHLNHQMEQVVHPDDRDRVIETFTRVDEEGLDYEIEYRIVRPDGEIRHVCEIGEAVFDDSGRPVAHRGTIQDITERRQSEEALRESEARLSAIMNNAPALIYLKDLEGRHILTSQMSERIFGGNSSIFGKTPFDLFPSEYASLYVAHDREVIETGQAVERELDAVTSEGLRTYIIVKFPIPGPDGRISAIGAVATDITERKKAEDALRKSEALLRAIVDNSPVDIFVKDLEGRYLIAGPRSIEDYGGGDKMEGRTTHEVLAKDLADTLVALDREVMASGQAVTRELDVSIGGEDRVHLTLKYPIRDVHGDITAICAFGYDITERKRAEDALRRSEAKFRALIEGSIQGIYIYSDVKPLFVNQACAEMFGYDSVEEFGAIESMVPHIAPHERKRLKAYRDARLRGDEAPVRHINEFLRKDGSALWLESINTVVDWDGQPAVQCTMMDVTERRAAQEGLWQSEARFRAFMEHSPVEIYQKDLEGRHISLSKQSEKVFGRISDVTGKTAHDLFPRDRADLHVAHDHAVIEAGQAIAREHELPTISGDRTFLVVKFPIPGADGRIETIGAVSTDITDRKRAEEELRSAHDELDRRVQVRTTELSEANMALLVEIEEHRRTGEALRESERRIRAIADGLPSLIAYVGTDQRYEFNNAAYKRWFELASDDCQGMHIKEVIGDANYVAVEPYIEKALAGEEVKFERQNSQGRFSSVNFFPDVDETGRVKGYYSLIHDITEAKHAENALIESRELLRAILDVMPVAISLKRSDMRYVFMNRYLATAWGVDPAEAVGKTSRQILDAELAASIDERDHLVCEGREAQPYYERRLANKAGDDRIWMASKVPIKDDDGNLRYILSAALDVTELKARERELRQAQKMEAVGQLTGGIAHDFNNVLFIIQGNLMQLEAEDADQVGIQRSIESIKTAAALGSDLTRSLLAFSRQQSLEPTVIDTFDTIRSTIAILLRTIGDTINIRPSCDKDIWPVLIDRGQLEIALLNLALNARDAMPDGGELTIAVANLKQRRRRRRDAMQSPPEGDYVELRVSDTGVGMSAEIADQCFEPFYTTKPSGSGTGLGLSMVYGFIKQSGGFIDIESDLNKGTTVTMYLPRAEQSATSATAVQSVPNEIKGGEETILVAEDNPEVRRLAVAFLNRLGYRTLEACDGNEALDVLAREPDVDLLFTDIVMPGGLNGFELASRSKARLPELKVLFCSAHPNAEISHADVIEKGAPLIPKPYKPDDLGRIVRRVLDERGESPTQ